MESASQPCQQKAEADGVMSKPKAKDCSGGEANSGARTTAATSGKLARMPQAKIDWILARNTKPTPPPGFIQSARTAAAMDLLWEYHLEFQAWVRREYESKGFVEAVNHSAYLQSILDESDSDSDGDA
ncbi:hypothetical protein BRADI_4g13896v3 [Brachypodium distachyon]|uniref:Uncharacterized protein n=1 Tax=Brachypodium distachyon TaxID=15368 RepID=I1IKF9_BRADI|nr:hypothetical protein BRADI_4g13896v3 [Brachypodium distachyon]